MYDAGLWVHHLDLYPCGILGKDAFGPGRPFYQTNIPGIQAILHPGPYGLLFILQPVQVDMKNPATGIFIFIYDGKSWASHGACNPFFITQGMNKGCFAGAHIAIKGYHLTPINKFPKTMGRLPDVIQCRLQLHKDAKIMAMGRNDRFKLKLQPGVHNIEGMPGIKAIER